jgi:hypothetical protein
MIDIRARPFIMMSAPENCRGLLADVAKIQGLLCELEALAGKVKTNELYNNLKEDAFTQTMSNTKHIIRALRNIIREYKV